MYNRRCWGPLVCYNWWQMGSLRNEKWRMPSELSQKGVCICYYILGEYNCSHLLMYIKFQKMIWIFVGLIFFSHLVCSLFYANKTTMKKEPDPLDIRSWSDAHQMIFDYKILLSKFNSMVLYNRISDQLLMIKQS